MPRIIIERTGVAASMEETQPDAEWCKARVMELASASPPYLEEEPLTLTDEGPAEDGTKRRYTIRAVMNTDKGMRLIVRK